MTTDFRALCAELTDCLEKADWPHRYKVVFQQWMDIAHAALAEADGPAVPEGREPASVVGEPSDTELLELMPETMRDEFSYAAKVCADATGNQVKPGIFRVCLNTAALEYARAALARWGHQPAPPAEGEQRHPAPVPVIERLPGPDDCDAEGRCWWFLPAQQLEILRQSDAWSFRKHTPRKDDYCRWTHWLPAHTLPLPAGEVEPNAE